MSFRAGVIRHLRFDERLHGIPRAKDVDFCARLGPDRVLVIATRARTEHRQGTSPRASDDWIRGYVQGQLYPYYRNWSRAPINRLCQLWFVFGCLLLALYASCRRLSFTPMTMFFRGVREAIELGRSHPPKNA